MYQGNFSRLLAQWLHTKMCLFSGDIRQRILKTKNFYADVCPTRQFIPGSYA